MLAFASTGCLSKLTKQSAVHPAAPFLLDCVVSPASVFPGDPVQITGTVSGVPPSTALSFLWSSSPAAQFSGKTSTVVMSTKDLRSGQYQVQGVAADAQGRPILAVPSCNANVTVKPFDPPTLALADPPRAVPLNGFVTLRLQGISPQNRPLVYSCNTSIGTITGSGATFTYSAIGVAPGADIAITCNVIDDQGQSASAQIALPVIGMPRSPPSEVHAQSLCSISFSRDAPPRTRVNPEGYACLDDIALTMARDATARLAISGNATIAEGSAVATARADSAFLYLVTRKGIDAGRLERFDASRGDQTVQFLLIPAGANTPNAGIRVTTLPSAGVTAPDTGIAGTNPPPPGPAANPSSSCTGYAIVAFPSLVDLSSHGPLPQSAFLVVGRTTPTGTIADSVRQTICSTLAPNAADCIAAADWTAKTNACPAQSHLQVKLPLTNQSFDLTIWMKSDGAMPLSILPTLALPSAMQAVLQGDGSPKAPLQIGSGLGQDSWTLTISKDADSGKSLQLSGRMALKDSAQTNVFANGDLLFAVTLRGQSETLTIWDKANKFIDAASKSPLLTWLGISVPTLGIALGTWFRKKVASVWGSVTAPAVAVALPEPAAAVVHADPPQMAAAPAILVVHDNQPAADTTRPGAPRRTRSRSAHGGRDPGDS